jgi:hypothetical protein
MPKRNASAKTILGLLKYRLELEQRQRAREIVDRAYRRRRIREQCE